MILIRIGYSEQHDATGIFFYGPVRQTRTPDGRLRAELFLMFRRPWLRWLR